MTPRPPRLAEALLWRVARPHWREHLLGDSEEEFAGRARTSSRRRAQRPGTGAKSSEDRSTRASRPPRTREPKGRSMLRLRTDVASAWRTIRRQPRFAVLLMFVLGGSVGASGSVLAIVDKYLWRPLPYPSADRLVSVGTFVRDVRPPRDLRALEPEAVSDVADLALAWDFDGFTILGGARPVTVMGAWTTADVFPFFGIAPIAGRVFTPAEVASGAPVAVISHRLWQDQFGGDPAAIGRTFLARGTEQPRTVTFTIVGVMPARFWHFNDRTDLFVPLGERREAEMLRLRDGISPDAAAALLTARIATANPDSTPAGASRCRPCRRTTSSRCGTCWRRWRSACCCCC